MVCKEDVVSWFNELESYKRIEAMCTLLNMCLPFELRFLGTCIEDLGRRDFQLLRGVANSVNNPGEPNSLYEACMTGGPSDQRIRRKLALYVALLHSRKTPCVNELFRVLSGWDYRDLLAVPLGVPLEEILLLYTLAHWHPVFSFDQRQYCGHIVKRLTEDRLGTQGLPTAQTLGQHSISKPPTQMPSGLQTDTMNPQLPNMTRSNSSTMTNPISLSSGPQSINVQNVTSLSNLSQVADTTLSTNMPMSAMSSTRIPGMAAVMHSVPAVSPVGLTVNSDGLIMPLAGHMIPPVLAMADFTVPQGPWSRTSSSQGQALGPLPTMEHPRPYTTPPSPQLSQPSSPMQSRVGSPVVCHTTQRLCRSAQHRRPPPESTPPLMHQGQHIQGMDNASEKHNKETLHKSSLKQLRNITLHEIAHMEEEKLLKLGIPAGAIQQLRSIVNCNGLGSTLHSINQNLNCQMSLNRSKYTTPMTYCAKQLNALQLDADCSRHQSSASDSGSSGSAGHSPPDTPAPPYNNRPKERRMNGRTEKMHNPSVSHSESMFYTSQAPSVSVGNITGPPQCGPVPTTQYAYLQHSHFSSPRTVFTHFPPTYRPPPVSFQPNGDIVYPYPPPYMHPIPLYPPNAPKMSCWNCGASGHTGSDCKEQTMEEITKGGCYTLDYSTAPPDISSE